MDPVILDIIKSFESKSKSKSQKYRDFLAYVYSTFDKKINLCKAIKLKNKYIKMRQSALEYIIVNEKDIKNKIYK
jgi:hypothetical protein